MSVLSLRLGAVAAARRHDSQAQPSLSLVQFASGSTGAVTSLTSITPAFAAPSQAGSTVVLIVGTNSSVATPSGWTLDDQRLNYGAQFVFSRMSAGQTTFSPVPISGVVAWALLEISGLTSGLVDGSVDAGVSGFNTVPFSTGTTPGLASTSEICIASWLGFNNDVAATWSGYTNSYVNPGINPVTTNTGGLPNVGLAVTVRTVSSTAAQESTATPSISAAPTAILVTYAAGVIVPVAPTAPAGVVATGGNGQATVIWEVPYDGNAVIDSYRVTSVPATTTQTTTTTGIIFPGLANGTAYTFKVAAHNSVGWSTDSAPSSSVTPATLSLRQIDGGTTYYSNWGTVGGNSFSDSASFFPIGVWYEGVSQQADIDLDKGCGLNTYVVLTPDSSLSLVYSNGMKFLAQTLADSWQGQMGSPGITGWMIDDEPDLSLAVPAIFTYMADIDARYTEGRIRHTNYGMGLLFRETDADAAQLVNTYQDIVSADAYWFTDPQIGGATGGGLFYGGQTLTYDQRALAHNYGLVIDRLRGLVSPPCSKPVWGFVEVGWPSTWTAVEGGRTILPAECQAAVWQVIIHGARGIIYFNHSFGGPHQAQSCLRESAYADIRAAVTTTNAQIMAWAPVLNAPFADNYASSANLVDFMVKYYNSRYYIFAGARVNATDQSVTFNIPASGTVTVLDESRTIPIVGGQFTDTFADGNACHKYQIN